MKAAAISCLLMLFASASFADDPPNYFEKSYAIVVGITDYKVPDAWKRLEYAEPDAKEIAALLAERGFEVTRLLGREATKGAILATMEDQIAPRLGENDRVLFFFAGHGTQRVLSNEQTGYLVPYDGKGSSDYSSFIRLSELNEMSTTMGQARHQLFILDSCFGGLAAERSGAMERIDPQTRNYLLNVSRRKARQLITAGGPDEKVRDSGPGGHSLFGGQLVSAIKDGNGDLNADGIVTFFELANYLVPAASAYNQTPGVATMRGHQMGEFWFSTNPKTTTAGGASMVKALEPLVAFGAMLEGQDEYNNRTYALARIKFEEAANTNAEAMNYLGKLYWEGWGGDVDEGGAIHYLEKAGKRGHVTAMQSLVNIYKFQGKEYNQLHWQVRLDRALELAASLPLRGSSQRPASQVVDEKTLVVPRRRLRAIPGQSQPQ